VSGPSLVAWGGGETRSARTRQAEGALVVAWEGADTLALERAGVPFRRLEEVLGAQGLASAEAAGHGFARVWGRLPLSEGRSFRELASWRGQSLLWACEAFQRTQTAAPRAARRAELCLGLLDAVEPGELDACGLADADAVLLARACTARGVLYHGATATAGPLPGEPVDLPRVPRRGWRERLARRRAAPGAAPGETPLLVALVPGSTQRAALAPLLEAVAADLWLRTVVLDAEDRERFASAASRQAGAQAVARLRATHDTLAGTPALAASYAHRGIGFADLAAGDLALLLLRRLPVVVRGLETTLALLETLRPALLLVVEPEHDARRALGLAAAEAGVPWVALRVDAAEPDEPERADAGPRPALALVLPRGADPRALVARLREAAHGRVGAS
jgi:hypothetical protein